MLMRFEDVQMVLQAPNLFCFGSELSLGLNLTFGFSLGVVVPEAAPVLLSRFLSLTIESTSHSWVDLEDVEVVHVGEQWELEMLVDEVAQERWIVWRWILRLCWH